MLERRAGHANRASHRTDPRSREGTRTAHPASEKRGTEVRRELLNEEASNQGSLRLGMIVGVSTFVKVQLRQQENWITTVQPTKREMIGLLLMVRRA